MNPKYVCLCDNLTMNDKTSCVCEDKNLGPEDCDVLQALLKCNKTHRDCIYYRKYEEGHNRLRRVELNFDKFINATQVVFFEKPDFCLSSERISSNGTHTIGYFTDNELRYIAKEIEIYLKSKRK